MKVASGRKVASVIIMHVNVSFLRTESARVLNDVGLLVPSMGMTQWHECSCKYLVKYLSCTDE